MLVVETEISNNISTHITIYSVKINACGKDFSHSKQMYNRTWPKMPNTVG